MPKHLSFAVAIFIGVRISLSLFHTERERKKERQSLLTNAFFYTYFYPSPCALFFLPPRHLEQKHTHLHIDFVNALFIYLFVSFWCWRYCHYHSFKRMKRGIQIDFFVFLFAAMLDPIAMIRQTRTISMYLQDGKEIVSRSRWLPIIYSMRMCWLVLFSDTNHL